MPRSAWDDELAVVNAREAEHLIRMRLQSVNHAEAQRRLNTSAHLMNQLIDANLLPRHKQGMGHHAYRFLIPELDALLASVLSGASPVAPGTDRGLSLAETALAIKSSVHEITGLIINRRLQWVGSSTDSYGFASILVDPDEVAEVLRQSHPKLLTAEAAAARLNLSDAAVRYVIGKLLAATTMKHPVTRQMRLFLDPADVDRFDAEYISLFNLSRLTKRASKALKVDLAKRSIHPALEKTGVATIYRRTDLI